MGTKRTGCAAVFVETKGKLYVVGGTDFPSALASAEAYDVATDTWAAGDMPEGPAAG